LLTQGQIYIGFPTYQTTGIKAHIYSQFIPTVEREQIDFIDSNLRQWNLELLSMGAHLSRSCYEIQLQLISNDYNTTCNGIYPTLSQSKNDHKYAKFIESYSFLLSH
jgi:replication fork clamp-binding protein CrfC